MARSQAKSYIKKHKRQSQVLKDQAKQPQGVKRKSARLQAVQQVCKQSISKSDLIPEVQTLSSPQTSNIPDGRRRPDILHNPLEPAQKLKRKRGREAKHSSPQDQDRLPSKRPRTSPSSCIAEERVASNISETSTDPIQYWVYTGRWPKRYFEQDSQVREDLEQDSWLEEQMERSATQIVEYVEINGYRYPRPIKNLPTSLRRKQSDSSLNSSNDQKKRERKSVAYRDTRYVTLLAAQGSFLKESALDITEASKRLLHRLLKSKQDVPKDSLFRDGLFKKTCQKVEDRNEARVIRSINPNIVPSAEDLETLGATHLEHLIEAVSESWMASIPVEGPKPQPDYSVGFRRSAFTDEQLKKVDPLIGSVFETSFFVATYQMYFPFLTCEVKCGAQALDIADRQNAHSMTVAVRGIVELFKAVKREKDLHREILAFSISHDHRSVRIYGHYPVIEGDNTTFYRHPIRTYDFTEQEGKEKWTAYKFTKNIYDVWMPLHLKRICSAIDKVPPDINFEVSRSELRFPDDSQLQLSQELEGHLSQQSNADSISAWEEDDSLFGSQDITPTTSITQRHEPEFKKARNKRAAEQRS